MQVQPEVLHRRCYRKWYNLLFHTHHALKPLKCSKGAPLSNTTQRALCCRARDLEFWQVVGLVPFDQPKFRKFCWMESARYFYKSRSETTAFDQSYFRGRLNANNTCQQVLLPKHRGVFRMLSCPFAAVCGLRCQQNLNGGLAEFLGRRLEEHQRPLRVIYGWGSESVAFQETKLIQEGC